MISVNSIDPNTFYTTAEAMTLLHKSNAWFTRHRWKGTGPKCSIGIVPVLYKGSELLAWIESRSSVQAVA
jgi:hypothetical protein